MLVSLFRYHSLLNHYTRFGNSRKCGGSRWNFADISFHIRVITTSGLESAILNFTSRPTSGNFGSVTSELGMVENVGVAVGISLKSLSISELLLLPV